METSGLVPRETKFEGGKEQSNDNHPSRNREMTERNDQSSSTRNQHNEKMKLVEDSSDSETDYESRMLKLMPNSFLLSSNNNQIIMKTSGAIPIEKKFEEGKEQPYDNHPTRNRELTDRNDQSLSTRNQHNEKMKLDEDSSDSENEQLETLHRRDLLLRTYKGAANPIAFEGIAKSLLKDRLKNKVPVAKPVPPPPSPPVSPM